MANQLQLNESTPFVGLGTATFTVVIPGIYTVAVSSTIPFNQGTSFRADQAPAFTSALQTVVNQNGSPVMTLGGVSANPTATQPAVSGQVRIECAATDVITVVFSSSSAADATPNAVKSIINLFQGE